MSKMLIKEIRKQENEINELKQKLDSIKFYIEQNGIKDMLWGKEILKIIGKNND